MQLGPSRRLTVGVVRRGSASPLPSRVEGDRLHRPDARTTLSNPDNSGYANGDCTHMGNGINAAYSSSATINAFEGVRADASGRDRDSTLPRLRWVGQEDLVYDRDANTSHRAGPRLLPARCTTTSLPARSALELTWAPFMCRCRPEVTLALGGACARAESGESGDLPPEPVAPWDEGRETTEEAAHDEDLPLAGARIPRRAPRLAVTVATAPRQAGHSSRTVRGSPASSRPRRPCRGGLTTAPYPRPRPVDKRRYLLATKTRRSAVDFNVDVTFLAEGRRLDPGGADRALHARPRPAWRTIR